MGNMTKPELVEAVANKTKLSKKDTEAGINALIETISGALAKGEKVALIGFGTFEVKERAARDSRNPKTGATVHVPAKKAPTFSAGKSLKEAVNK